MPQLTHFNNALAPNLAQSENQNEWSGYRVSNNSYDWLFHVHPFLLAATGN